MSKYYIANDIKFLTGRREYTPSPSASTHMKRSKAEEFVKQHPNYEYYKERSTTKGNDYVICTPMKYISQDGITKSIKQARTFSTAESAYQYLDSVKNQLDPDLCVVIDEKFKRVKRPKVTKDEDFSINLFDFAKSDTTERIKIPPMVKQEVYKRYGGKCAICGKSLEYNYTIDHIVPLGKGGTNRLENLRPTHSSCNRLKNDFTDKELLQGTSDIFCNVVTNNPLSPQSAMFFRSFIRGMISAAKGGTQ